MITYQSYLLLSDNSKEGLIVETSEVHKHVWKMKNKKSPGIDSLPYEVLKNDTVINALTRLYQMCLDSRKIPSVWTKAIISPIPKSSTSDSRIPMNYRGISLISRVAKIYSSILNARVLDVLEEEELIVDEQNGFRSGRSCEDHIFVLDSIIRNRLSEDMPTFTAFIDLQKAFDCVNRDFLLNKILANGIDSKVFLAIKSLYSYTEACVKLPGGLYTDWFQTLFGVKQGDNLSPTLFSVFLNDLATVINDLNAGVNTPNAGNVSILYADDIVLIAPSEENLQTMLNALSAWTEKWLLNIHPDKSQIVHFRKNGSDATKHCFKCGKINLDIVSFYKYLGVIFTEHLNYEKMQLFYLKQVEGHWVQSLLNIKHKGLWVIQHLRNYMKHVLLLFWTTLQAYGVFHGIIAWRQFKIEPFVYI